MDFQYFRRKVKDVKLNDFLSALRMFCAIFAVPFFRRKYRHTWLIGEADNEARDNGYHFYRYMRLNHPEQSSVYFISSKAKDYSKVKQLGPTVEQGSIQHWIMYFTSEMIISSQKGGKPNAAVCAFLELKGLFRPKFVFLQHGVTKDRNDWMLADRCCFDKVIAATNSEYDFLKSSFGYKAGTVVLTGFPRFDNLHNCVTQNRRVLIMPTWRTWLCNNSSKGLTRDSDFVHSTFTQKWLELLNSEELQRIIDENHLEVLFYPHRQLQKYLSKFKVTNKNIRIVNSEELDIQEALKSSAIMITDWSSVYFDMFYMKKPVIFYQFDEEDFRSYHYQQGWFDYKKNDFAESFVSAAEVLEALERQAKKSFCVDQKFLKAHQQEFVYFDQNNSSRIYKILRKEDTKA